MKESCLFSSTARQSKTGAIPTLKKKDREREEEGKLRTEAKASERTRLEPKD
jgi:hypothetical protein